jgi:hypothetical protein
MRVKCFVYTVKELSFGRIYNIHLDRVFNLILQTREENRIDDNARCDTENARGDAQLNDANANPIKSLKKTE